MSNGDGSISRRVEIACLIFYAILLLVTLSTLAATFTINGLFPLQTDSLEWSNGWLLATVIDYYGTCLCFCGVVVASEDTWRSAILWVIACCIVKSPACCLYVFLWLTKEGGTLRLKRQSSYDLPTNNIPEPPVPPMKSVTIVDDTTVGSESPKLSHKQPPAYPPQSMEQFQQYRQHRVSYNQYPQKNRSVERAVIS